MEDININLKTRICCYLNYLVSINETRTYGEVADHCDIPSPRKIRKLNDLLLNITEDDIKNKKPLRTALVVSKIIKFNNLNLPNEDFFILLKDYEIYNGKYDIISFYNFHKALLLKLLN